MWRIPLQGVLLVLLALVIAVMPLGFWTRATIYNEDRFVSAVANLSTDPAVQAVAIEQVMNAIDNAVDAQVATQGLSPAIAFTYQMFRSDIESAVMDALASPAYKPYWTEALRQLHTPLTDLLKGNTTPLLDQTEGQVRINLYGAYQLAQQNLPERALQVLVALDLSQENMWITVADGSQLADLHRSVRLFNTVLAVMVILALATGLGFILLARRRLRAISWVLLAIAVGLGIQRLLLELGGTGFVSSLTDGNERDAASVFYDTLVDPLRRIEWYVMVAAVVSAIAVFLVDRQFLQKELRLTDDSAGAGAAPAS